MAPPKLKPIRLILEDHSEYDGFSFGAEKNTQGEVVFNTSMMGYPESLTDPSYRRQILIITYPLVGNYGVPGQCKTKENVKKNFESWKIHLKGIIVSEYSDNYCHWNARQSLGDWLKKEGVPGITGLDTRALTQKIREKGTMLGRIEFKPEKEPAPLHDPNLNNLVSESSIRKPKLYQRGPKKIVLIDTGMKNNILRSFLNRNISVYRVPWNYDFFAEKRLKFNGVFLTNGPGDPDLLKETHQILKTSLDRGIPTFGICLGTQIMAIAAGAKTFKLKYGHRSQNQPCVDLTTGRCYITSQNHGFAVDGKSLPKGWRVWFENANDRTVEGIRHVSKPFRAVQFHPEATPGPVDTEFLFDEFIKLL